MKKLLFIFMIVDFVFVGVILTLSHRTHRNIASTEDQAAADLPDLTEGQKNKWQLVKTFQLDITPSELVFSTDKLQMICESSTSIELRYLAQNIATGGESPVISHIFSCSEIRKKQNQSQLVTKLSDFKLLQTKKLLVLDGSQMAAKHVYSDEEFPMQWRLSEVTITGPYTFTINQFEIQKTLLKNFDFDLTSAK